MSTEPSTEGRSETRDMSTPLPARFARIGTVARWKPVHLGHAAMLEALPPEHEEAVRFFYFTDLAQEDIAWFLGTSPERARQILEDAEVMLRGAANVRFPRLCANGGGR